jgi:N-acetylglucosaminyl-diphospho-decaprenol L-rhamnosyltransferase
VCVTELSIVVPTFNTGRMTLRCCRAVQAAMPASSELLVIDDGSSDGTAELLERELPSVRVVRLEANRGYAVAANRGVEEASGAVVLLLNSDAVVDPPALRALVDAFAADPMLGVAGAGLVSDDGTAQWSGGRTPTLLWIAAVVSGAGAMLGRLRRRRARAEPRPETDRNSRREVDWVSGAAMAFRRQVWDVAGPLDERFRFYCQDLVFCLAARDRGWRIRIVPEARVMHALGATIAGHDPLHHDPERLWLDLLDWGRARHGRAWGGVARGVMIAAAWGRVAARGFRRDAIFRAAVRLW